QAVGRSSDSGRADSACCPDLENRSSPREASRPRHTGASGGGALADLGQCGREREPPFDHGTIPALLRKPAPGLELWGQKSAALAQKQKSFHPAASRSPRSS